MLNLFSGGTMLFTRKDFLRKTIAASVFLFWPIASFLKNSLFAAEQNDYIRTILESNEIPDFIIISNPILDKTEFVALRYDRKIYHAPHIVFASCGSMIVKGNIQKTIDMLLEYGEKHGVSVYFMDIYSYFEHPYSLVVRIKNCGVGNEISEDLYYYTACIYAMFYRDTGKLTV